MGVSTDIQLLKKTFSELKKGIKNSVFNSHRKGDISSYLQPAHALLTEYLVTHGDVEVRLEVSTYLIGQEAVFEDDNAEQNIIYPLWQAGVRLLIFRRGLSLADLQRFYLLVADF